MPRCYCNRGNTLHELNRYEEALASYEKAIALKPDFGEAEFALCMAELPILYMDEAEIMTRRTAYEQRLRALCDEGNRSTNLADFAKGVGSANHSISLTKVITIAISRPCMAPSSAG